MEHSRIEHAETWSNETGEEMEQVSEQQDSTAIGKVCVIFAK